MASWTIEMYASDTGVEPVSEWIEAMSPREQADALRYIEQLALLGVQARRPLVAPVEDKLYELRWKSSDKQHRILYFAYTGRRFVLLHGLIKKTGAIPQRDKRIAKDRMSDYIRRHDA